MTEPEAGTAAAHLWQLLPAVYRLRDGEAGGVLAELLDVFGDQLEVLAEELAQLYDDQFVETAAPWATPYVGGVVGYRPIHGVVPEVVSPRAEVANTVAYRRRKGTAACGRVWFRYCVVATRSNDSYTRAGHPVTSRASCSMTAAVPLRRR